jgi:hypothetical protein
MVSPYILRSLERARLSVQYYPPLLPPYVEPDAWPEQWVIRKDGVMADFAYDPAKATRAYLDLCASLTESAVPSSPGSTAVTAESCSGTSPETTGAL